MADVLCTNIAIGCPLDTTQPTGTSTHMNTHIHQHYNEQNKNKGGNLKNIPDYSVVMLAQTRRERVYQAGTKTGAVLHEIFCTVHEGTR